MTDSGCIQQHAVEEVRGDGSLRYLTPDLLARLGVPPQGVLHVGAHLGEEMPIYLACGFGTITLVEPWLEGYQAISRACPTARVIRGLVASEGQVGQWRQSYRSMASGTSPAVPDVINTLAGVPVYHAHVIQQKWPVNVLVIDTQGTELDVLHSADLAPLDLVIVETDTAGRDASPHAEVAVHLEAHGWRLAQRWWHGGHTYADCLFVPAAPRG